MPQSILHLLLVSVIALLTTAPVSSHSASQSSQGMYDAITHFCMMILSMRAVQGSPHVFGPRHVSGVKQQLTNQLLPPKWVVEVLLPTHQAIHILKLLSR